MSLNHVGNVQPTIDKEEHWHAGGDETKPGAKRVVLLDDNGDQITNFSTDVSSLATSAKQDDILEELKKYATNAIDDYTETDIVYFCREKADGTWYIKKFDDSGNFPIVTHATVTNNPTVTSYGDAYTARTSLTYGTFSQAF